MKRVRSAFTLLLLAAVFLSGCSMLTAQGRSERAYAKYVRKCSKGRVKQQSRLTSRRMKIPELTPSEPVVKMDVGGPESTTAGDGGM
jgi:hypothetical protein